MAEQAKQEFTRYEIARIVGARGLQIAMDAPVLIKLSEEELKEMRYDSLRIAEKEFTDGALPIAIQRPLPKKRAQKLEAVKEEKVSDAEIIAKSKEIEKEIEENPDEYSLTQSDDELPQESEKSEEQ
jgi:DNA-directed RNA polymerase subunit K